MKNAKTDNFTPEQLLDLCLDLIGPIEVSDETREVLVEHVSSNGILDLSDGQDKQKADQRVAELLS
ncbi:uncharacterized protein METZ01_LOCUS373337, partial [marine metagenome]